MSNLKRLKYIDFIKGVAIICIIFGHLGIGAINRIVYTFHVPVFFFITGYLTNTETDFLSFIKKKTKKLIIPYFLTCITIILFAGLINMFFTKEGSTPEIMNSWIKASLYGSGANYTKPFHIKMIGAIWFLLASFFGQVFMYVIYKARENVRPLLVIGLFLFGFYSHTFLFQFPLSVQEGMCSTLFIYAGYIYRKFKLQIDNNRIKKYVFVLSLVMWIRFILFFTSFYVVECNFGNGLIDIISSLCACYCVLETAVLSKSLIEKKNVLADKICFFGEISLIILCVHLTEMNIFPYKYVLSGLTGMTFKIVKLLLKLIIIFVCTPLIAKIINKTKESIKK